MRRKVKKVDPLTVLSRKMNPVRRFLVEGNEKKRGWVWVSERSE